MTEENIYKIAERWVRLTMKPLALLVTALGIWCESEKYGLYHLLETAIVCWTLAHMLALWMGQPNGFSHTTKDHETHLGSFTPNMRHNAPHRLLDPSSGSGISLVDRPAKESA